ncbi:MAG: ribonuclease Y [bacterium]
MLTLKVIILVALTGLAGVAIGYFLRLIISLGKKGSMELEIKEMLLGAREEAKRISLEAEKAAQELAKTAREEFKEKEEKLQKTEERLINKESLLDKRQIDIDHESDSIKQKVQTLETEKERVEGLEKQKLSELEKIAQLSKDDAKQELFHVIEKQSEEDLAIRMQKLEMTGQEKIERHAKDILAACIQRYGNSVSSDVFTTHVNIPNDEIKGKVIGKEGRNIKTFERMSGVELIVDDTPGAITISSFDPIRRQIARVALENLILDGRIQPAKIEEMIEKAKLEINKIIKEKGEQAAYEVGVFNLDPRLLSILGRLYFRTSYGQNVLQHSVEMTHIAGMIAEELGANVQVTKAGALLHDIGKAVDHEVAGTHVEIGRRILQKFNVSEEVVKAMQAHHEEYPFETVESIIVQVADSISGSRPGARRDSVENYLKRLEDLEKIATSFEGVEKAYALQAGREIRIFINPAQMGDIEAKELARNVALRVEQELKYPGEIKVTVIRETRVIDYAR